MVVCVKRASPSDQACHLSTPVHLCRNFHGTVDSGFPELLCCCLGNINTVLLAGHYADHKADFFSVTFIDTVAVFCASGCFQNLLGFFRIVIIVFYIFVIIDVSLQRTVCRHSLAQKHGINDRLTVNRIAYRRNDVSVFRPVIVCEVKQDSAVICRCHIVAGKTVFFLEILRIFRVKQCQIQFAGFQLHCLCIIIRYNFENDLVNLWCTEVIIFIFCQNDRLAFIPAFQLVRTCSDRCSEEIRLLHIFTFQQVLRQDCHCHILQESHVWLGKPESYRLIIDHGNLFHILIVRCIFRSVFRIHDCFDGEFHIIRRKLFSIMPLDAVPDMKGIGAGFCIILPFFCQARNNVVIRIVCRQSVEQKQVDFAVLVHRWIDSGIIGRTVNQGCLCLPCLAGRSFRLCFRQICTVAVFPAVLTACRKGCCKRHHQHQR